jgi:hypothetical protein
VGDGVASLRDHTECIPQGKRIRDILTAQTELLKT